MKHQHRSICTLSAITILLLASCSMFGPDEQVLTVDQAEPVSLGREASTDDFGTLSSETRTPDTLEEAVGLIPGVFEALSGGGVETSMNASMNGDDPVQVWLEENSFTVVDEDDRFIVQGTAQDTVNLSAENPDIEGVIELLLDLDLSGEFEETDTRATFSTRNSAAITFELIEAFKATGPDADEVMIDGFIAAAANFNANYEAERQPGAQEPDSVRLASSSALEISVALTVEADIDGEKQGGNFLLTVSYGDNVFAEAETFEAFEEQVLSQLNESEYTITLAVYDADGTLENEWTIDVDTIDELTGGSDFGASSHSLVFDRVR